jgi:hypothetical protein
VGIECWPGVRWGSSARPAAVRVRVLTGRSVGSSARPGAVGFECPPGAVRVSGAGLARCVFGCWPGAVGFGPLAWRVGVRESCGSGCRCGSRVVRVWAAAGWHCAIRVWDGAVRVAQFACGPGPVHVALAHWRSNVTRASPKVVPFLRRH